MPVHQLHEVQGALRVRAQVDVRILDAVADPGAGGEIEDGIETVRGKNGLELVEILNVGLDEGEPLTPLEGRETVALHADVVSVVQIIETDDLDSLIEKEFRDARSDESGGAGDEDGFHQGESGSRMAPLMALMSALSRVSTSE